MRFFNRCGLLSTAILLLSLPAIGSDNLRLHGALVAEPCSINPGDDLVEVDFGTIVDKYLYLNQRTAGHGFQLRLADCDIALGNLVKVKFKGTENSSLPGLLALNAGSQASGVAIGIETPAGQALALGQFSTAYTLTNGSNAINLQAYVRAEPAALAAQNIQRGAFTAVATFSLEYP